MNILVTGAAGFIAFHLIEVLLKQGHSVLGIDNFISGQHANIEELSKHKNFSFYEVDIINLTDNLINSKFDQIYHLACPASPPIYQINPIHTLDTCYIGTKNILNIAKKNNARILFSSTSEVYGDPLEHPQSEDYRGNVNSFGPRACYDEGKRISETLIFEYKNQGVSARIARIFNTYGTRMSVYDGRVVINFITQALRNKPLTIYGTGLQTRSFCYISDLVNGLLALMESNIDIPINLGSDGEFTILYLAECIVSLVNPALKIEYLSLPQDDPQKRRPSLTLARDLLNWQPKVHLQEGLKILIDHYKNSSW